VTHISRFFK